MRDRSKFRALVAAAINASDEVVLQIEYRDGTGKVTKRLISPIRFEGPGRLVAMCLGRQEIRTFYLGRVLAVLAGDASEVLAPVPIERAVAAVAQDDRTEPQSLP